MLIEELIQSRAHRILTKLSQYRPVTTIDGIEFQAGEIPIGIYENYADSLHEAIVVPTLGIHVYLEEWLFIPYKQMKSAKVLMDLPADKRHADAITIHLQNGDVVTVPVRGGDERTHEVWEFLRYLQRVIRDVTKNANE